MAAPAGRLVITPWKWMSDLREVKRWFFESEHTGHDMRHHAVARVAVWKRRGHLPHEVGATANLIDAILHDNIFANSEYSILATYSDAFCRFVTGLVDSPTHGKKLSMFDKAKLIDMPLSFVEIRHQATHGLLPPSLTLLRYKSGEALDWLESHWWDRIDEMYGKLLEPAVFKMTNKEAVMKKFQDNLQAYAESSTIQSGKGKNGQSNSRSASAWRSYDEILEVCKGDPEYVRILVEVMVDGELPAIADLTAQNMLEIWDTLLQELTRQSWSFLDYLSVYMVQVLTQPSTIAFELDTFKIRLYSWLVHIYTSSNWEVLRTKRGTVTDIVKLCVQNPGDWTNPLSINITSGIADQGVRRQWAEIVSTTTGQSQMVIFNGEANAEPKMLSMEEQAEQQMWKQLESFGWSKAGADWAPRPLGL